MNSDFQPAEIDHGIFYPTKQDVLSIHADIIEEDEDADPGILNDGAIEYTLDFIEHGHFTECPETLHEKAFALMRLLAANHAFADGNKRTALNTTWVFYALNGHYFDFGEEIKAILKLLAVMERMVDQDEAREYFQDITYDESAERVPTGLVKLMRLTRWEREIKQRAIASFNIDTEEIQRLNPSTDDISHVEIEDDRDNEEEPPKWIIEYFQLVSEYMELKEEHGDELPDEVVGRIDQYVSLVGNMLDIPPKEIEGIDVKEGEGGTNIIVHHDGENEE